MKYAHVTDSVQETVKGLLSKTLEELPSAFKKVVIRLEIFPDKKSKDWPYDHYGVADVIVE
jgi:hypothetical protein